MAWHQNSCIAQCVINKSEVIMYDSLMMSWFLIWWSLEDFPPIKIWRKQPSCGRRKLISFETYHDILGQNKKTEHVHICENAHNNLQNVCLKLKHCGTGPFFFYNFCLECQKIWSKNYLLCAASQREESDICLN